MIVADASVLSALIADDASHGDRVRSLCRLMSPIAVPDIAVIETMSVLRRHWLAGALTASRFHDAVDDLDDLPCTVHPTRFSTGRIRELRENVTAYDAAYVWLAETLGCALLTSDVRLARAPGLRCEVHLVA